LFRQNSDPSDHLFSMFVAFQLDIYCLDLLGCPTEIAEQMRGQ